MPRIVLIIAGLDPTCGAGLVRDFLAARAMGCHPLGVVSVLTAQAGGRVSGLWPVAGAVLRRQVAALLDVYPVGAVKVGLLGNAAQAELVAELVGDLGVPVVLDPVLAASGGDLLLPEGVRGLHPVLKAASVVTPNLQEAAALAGIPVAERSAMMAAAERIRELGPEAVIVTGGHLPGDEVADLLWDGRRPQWFVSQRSPGSPRGTGCFFSTAVACGLARGLPLSEAVASARKVLLDHFDEAYALDSGELNF